MKINTVSQKGKWSAFYRNWKAIWRNPNISVYEKVALFNIFLYRSDNEGWCISERKMANDLGIGKETASKAIGGLLTRGFILANRFERKRSKLRLTGSLRSPDWVSTKPNNWATKEPTKYQSKYQNNNKFENSDKRTGEMEKTLSPEQLSKKIQELKERIKLK